jgi:hypothetical protein
VATDQFHAPSPHSGERIPGVNWIGGWVGPRAGQDAVENRKFLTLLGLQLRPLCRPAIPAPFLLLLPSLFTDAFIAECLGYICEWQAE